MLKTLCNPCTGRLFLQALVSAAIALHLASGVAQPRAAGGSESLNSDAIVERMVEHNRQRASDLKGYTAERRYTLSYHGFPGPLRAEMAVAVAYTAPATKRFRILSHSGAKLLIDEVLAKLLKSEEDAARDPGRTALNNTNYDFMLLGQEALGGRRCYVFHVEPRFESKYLYRGKVWVDDEDYAVTQIEAEPAKNPSYWIKQTKIYHIYTKTGQFWLPARNRSETTMRLGGTASLTIDYGTYQTDPAPAP